MMQSRMKDQQQNSQFAQHPSQSNNKQPQVVIVQSPRSGKIAPPPQKHYGGAYTSKTSNAQQHHQTIQNIDSHRSSLPQASGSQMMDMSAIQPVNSDQHIKMMQQTSTSGVQNTTNNNTNSHDMRQQIKSGKIGIFGNYLATRISSIQQQKFLLQSAGANKDGSNITMTSNSNPLSSRRVSARDATLHEQERLNLKQISTLSVTQAGPHFQQPHKNATSKVMQGGKNDITNQQQTNSFVFGASNFGSMSTSNDPKAGAAKRDKKTVTLGGGQTAPLLHFSLQSQSKVLGEKNQQSIAIRQQDDATFHKKQHLRQHSKQPIINTSEKVADMRQSIESFKAGGQHSSAQRRKEVTLVSNVHQQLGSADEHQKTSVAGRDNNVPSVNKSYQGGLSKLLKQVHLDQQQQQQMEQSHQRTPSLQPKTHNSFKPRGNHQQRAPTFFNSASTQHKRGAADLRLHHHDHEHDKKRQMAGSPDKQRQDGRNQGQQLVGAHMSVGSNQQKLADKTSSFEDNYYTVTTASHRPQNQSAMQQVNIRSQSHTPAQDKVDDAKGAGGNLSPLQVRKGAQYATNNSIGAVHRSFEQRGVGQHAQAKKPLVRDMRQLVNPGSGVGIDNADLEVNYKTEQSALSSNQLMFEQINQLQRDDKNLPLNSKLNAALRHNQRPGLGPCLEDRSLNLIDKIWGKFQSDQSQDKLKIEVTSRTDKIDKINNLAVQLIKPSNKRNRNENYITQSEEKSSSINKAVFLQNNSQSLKRAAASTYNADIMRSNHKRNQQEEANTPVWLPKKTLLARNPAEPPTLISGGGSASIAIEQTALAMHRVTDENFDYKDFNFIVGKNKQPGHQANQVSNGSSCQQHPNGRRSTSNSPNMVQNGRYDQVFKPNPNVDSYHVLQQQYGQKKRQSTQLLKSAQIYMDGAVNPGGSNQPASIKIQIEDTKPVRKLGSETKPAYVPMRSSQMKLNRQDSSSAYISNSQKKKNQQQWQVPKPKPLQKEDYKQMYHVTIQIDPSIPSPQNRRLAPSPVLDHNNMVQNINQQQPTSPYHANPHYNIIKHQAVPVKEHVITGLIDQCNVNGSPFEQNHHFFETRAAAQAAARLNSRALSPRSMDRQGNVLLFSPEPKLIELPGDENQLKTIPLMYPMLPKRQARQKNQSISGLSQIEDKTGLDQLIIHHSQRVGSQGQQSLIQSSEQPLKQPDAVLSTNPIDQDDEELKLVGDQAHNSVSLYARKPRQPYFCPYASAKIAKYKEKQDIKLKQKTGSQGEVSATEESKTDLRTAEQKAEDLKAHQKELMRKFLSKFPPKKLPNAHAMLEEERQRFMQARKDANRKYTEISANNNKPGRFAPLQFVICDGNNSQILRRVMQSRLACNMPVKDAELSSPTQRNLASTAAESTGDEKNPKNSEAGVNSFPIVGQNDPKLAQNFTTWQETNAPHLFNFKWKPTSSGVNYERLGKFGYKQLVNHIEGHESLTTKDQLFYNMKAYCEKKNIDVYRMIPLTFAVDFEDNNHHQKFDQILQILSVFEKNISLSPSDLSNKLQLAQNSFDRTIKSPLSVGPSEHQGKNLWLLKPTGFNRGIGIHVFNSLEDLASILWTHYRIQVTVPNQYKVNNSAPTNSAEVDQQAKETREREMQKLSQQIAQDEAKEDPDLQNALASVKEIKNSSFIVQKYIEAPLLYHKRKFDIRIWALIGYDGKFYLFKEAYVRTSSDEYDLSGDKLDQIYVHLTNNAVQKYSKNYGKFEEGNIVSVKALSEELANQDQYEISQSADAIEKSLYKQMRSQIEHSYEAVRSKLVWSKHTFEFVGYDFMVVPVLENDGDTEYAFQTRLIEANTNPCLEESNQLLKNLIPRMLDDMLKLTVDPLFGSQKCQTEQTASEETGLPVTINYPLEGYQDDQNMFELIASPVMP